MTGYPTKVVRAAAAHVILCDRAECCEIMAEAAASDGLEYVSARATSRARRYRAAAERVYDRWIAPLTDETGKLRRSA